MFCSSPSSFINFVSFPFSCFITKPHRVNNVSLNNKLKLTVKWNQLNTVRLWLNVQQQYSNYSSTCTDLRPEHWKHKEQMKGTGFYPCELPFNISWSGFTVNLPHCYSFTCKLCIILFWHLCKTAVIVCSVSYFMAFGSYGNSSTLMEFWSLIHYMLEKMIHFTLISGWCSSLQSKKKDRLKTENSTFGSFLTFFTLPTDQTC